MSKIIQALKALYVKLGGTASDVTAITETPAMINAIAGLDIGGSGSSELIVNYTESGDTFTTDKTYAEISAAISAGTEVIAKIAVTGGTYVCCNSAVLDESIVFSVSFATSDSEAMIISLTHSNADECTFDQVELTS